MVVTRLLCIVIAPFVVLVTSAVPAHAATRKCGTLVFAMNSEYAASDIVATKVSCATARRVARVSRKYNVATGRLRYSAFGFACRGTRKDDFLPSVEWRCNSGDSRVRFRRT